MRKANKASMMEIEIFDGTGLITIESLFTGGSSKTVRILFLIWMCFDFSVNT